MTRVRPGRVRPGSVLLGTFRGFAAALAAALAAAAWACVPPPGAGPLGGGPQPLPAPGSGTLRQDEITIQLSSGDLQVKVTPLAESVIRAAAPDTYRMLSGLTGRYSPEAVRRTGSSDPVLFLVSFFSNAPDVAFVPEEVQIIAQGARRRPDAILPVTPTWGERRLEQRETETAVYAFAHGVDLESDLVVVYGLVESHQWGAILPRVQAERARARARTGVVFQVRTGLGEAAPQPSRPYLEILR